MTIHRIGSFIFLFPRFLKETACGPCLLGQIRTAGQGVSLRLALLHPLPIRLGAPPLANECTQGKPKPRTSVDITAPSQGRKNHGSITYIEDRRGVRPTSPALQRSRVTAP